MMAEAACTFAYGFEYMNTEYYIILIISVNVESHKWNVVDIYCHNDIV
jgi:hypothetical protein